FHFHLQCTFFSAAVLEVQRFANIIAINPVHRTVKDTFIGSYPIPADTLVLGQIHNVMANSPVFTTPEKFSPERFLMDDGVTPNKEAMEQFCPFSIGKRVCVGEGMAKMELFIGLITIVQNFKVVQHMFFLWALLLLTTALAIYIWRFYENIKRYPKGPPPYPFVGNLLSLNFFKIHKEFAKYTKEYGSIFTVYLPKPHVVITDFDGVKEAFVKKGDDFIGRSGIFPDTLFQNVENGGVIFSQGENWREQRRASLHILRDFGMGKNLMEEQVLLSAHDFLAHLSSIKNKDEICLREPIQVFIGNIINKTLYGYSYEYDKSDRMMKAAKELNALIEGMRESRLIFLGQFFPIIYRLPVIGHMAKGRFVDMTAGLRQTIREDVTRALESYTVDQEPECLVQAYYQKMQSNPLLDRGENRLVWISYAYLCLNATLFKASSAGMAGFANSKSTAQTSRKRLSNFSYDNLLNVCMDFYTAGMETTTTTLRWATLLFATHPEEQEKVREEILRVIGPEGKPTSSDRQKMPYTNATIQEIQRWANILPMNVVHRTVRDTSVKGVKIPADTHVLGEIHQILAHSPVFKDGHEFRPERFLMEDGVTPNKEAVDHLCPFSMGKRQCAGEALARVELFVGVVSLLQNYRVCLFDVILMAVLFFFFFFFAEPAVFEASWTAQNTIFSYDNLFNVCSDLFLAGMETTATTLRWSALILAKHQDVQITDENEIRVVRNRRGKCDYVEEERIFLVDSVSCSGSVLELQRFTNIIAINAVHRTVKDTFIGSVPVPADTLVLGQIYNVLANSLVYPAPEKFSRERFLMDDGVTPKKVTNKSFPGLLSSTDFTYFFNMV
ncbi:unnamed protein product, partial [Haemonchus placei]|uniref:Cytochrome n=1 Tax=Haemonchus placei TaxID=6290 RepID=A0A0N4X5L9_HAEPC